MLKEIKSKLNIKIIFGFLLKRKKLKIIKYNKKLLTLLNIQLKDFEDFQILKELKNKYNVIIPDIEIDILKLQDKKDIIGILETIKEINFIGLKSLDISSNDILDITILEQLKLDNLEYLNLNENFNIRY